MAHTHTHTLPIVLRLSWILSRTTRLSQHQKRKTEKVKPIWIYWSKRQSEWQWHQLGHMQNLHLNPDT